MAPGGDVVRHIPAASALAALSALSALGACGFPAAGGREAGAQALVATLEKMVPLPDASRPLAAYERYYAVSADRIAAIYLASPEGSGRVHLVDRAELPKAKAEGCSAVTLEFDRASNQFVRILCNEVRLSHAEPAPAIAAPAIVAPPIGAPVPSGGERG
jgi:hypothetical protein